jgi:hypothetical protein
MTTWILLRDVTAYDLAMESADGEEGYATNDVIGPEGSTVTLLDDDGSGNIEVTGFLNDPYAEGFIDRLWAKEAPNA